MYVILIVRVEMLNDIWPIVFSKLLSEDRSKICTVSKVWEHTACLVTSRLTSKHHDLRFVRADYHWLIRTKPVLGFREIDNACLSDNLGFVKYIVKRLTHGRLCSRPTVSWMRMISTCTLEIYWYLIVILKKAGVVIDYPNMLKYCYSMGNIPLISYIESQDYTMPFTHLNLTRGGIDIIHRMMSTHKESLRDLLFEWPNALNIHGVFISACRYNHDAVLKEMLEDDFILSQVPAEVCEYYRFVKDETLREQIKSQLPISKITIQCFVGICAQCDVIIVQDTIRDNDISHINLNDVLSKLKELTIDLDVVSLIINKPLYDVTDDDLDVFIDGSAAIKKLLSKTISSKV